MKKVNLSPVVADRLERARAAERARLLELACGNLGAYYLQPDFYIPDSAPAVLLPPGEKPVITMDEICNRDDYEKIVYRRSGRYLSVYATSEEAARADPYRFARVFLPGGVLPWET